MVTPNHPGYQVRPIRQEDMFWLKDFDCAPLPVERDNIYLLFCVHFSNTSFVAVDSMTGEPLGFVLGFVPAGPRTAYMHYLFVVEGRRREGIATALTEAFMGAARSSGATSAALFTSRATAFYEAPGFERRDELFSPSVAEYLASKGHQVMTIAL